MTDKTTDALKRYKAQLETKEHYDLMVQFEREHRGRMDKEPKESWPRGIIYQDGNVNELFLAYRRGHAFAVADYRSDLQNLEASRDGYRQEAERLESEIARLQAIVNAPRGTSAQIQMERQLTAETIDGAMCFGFGNVNPPPVDDPKAHWLQMWWDRGREYGALLDENARLRQERDDAKGAEKHVLESYRSADAERSDLRRQIEAAQKQEPVAWSILNKRTGEHWYTHESRFTAQYYANEYSHRVSDGTKSMVVTPLYAEPIPADEDARDAARYRWLRDAASVATDHEPVVCASTPSDRECLFGTGLDAAIDAAMSQSPARAQIDATLAQVVKERGDE